jgi:sugar lactone lactonase YvrE
MADADYEILDSRFRRCINTTGKVEKLYEGCRWAEGPAYQPAWRSLVWSDIPNDRILRYDEASGTVGVFRYPAGYTNGNTVDRQGRLVTCEHGGRRVSRTEHDGVVVTLADRHEGKRLNSPNDVVVKSDDTVWFTDPAYGIESDYEGHLAEPEIGGCHVYRLDPASGDLRAVATDFARPNGIAFSPTRTCSTSPTPGRPTPRTARATSATSPSAKAAPSPAARSSRSVPPASSTASGSTWAVGSGSAPPTASTATTRTARCSAR